MRAIPRFEQQLDSLIQSYSEVKNTDIRELAVATLEKIQKRAYGSFQDFDGDFTQYLATLEERNKNLPDVGRLVRVWGEALELLSHPYWKKFLFQPEPDLAHYRTL